MLVMVLILAALCIAILAISTVRRYKNYERAYASLQAGTTRTNVLRLFGEPAQIRTCEKIGSWDGEPLPANTKKCLEEYWYFTRVSPEQWSVGFDRDGKVVRKYHHVSP